MRSRRRSERYAQVLDVRVNTTHGAVQSKTVNVSEHGLSVSSSPPLDQLRLRQYCELKIALPDGKEVNVTAVVARLIDADDPSAEELNDGIGFEFYLFDPQGRVYWRSYIDRLRNGLEGTRSRRPAASEHAPTEAEVRISAASGPQPPTVKKRQLAPPPSEDDENSGSTFIIKPKDLARLRHFVTSELRAGRVRIEAPVLQPVGTWAELVVIHPSTQEEWSLWGTVGSASQHGRGRGPMLEIHLPRMHADELETFTRFIERGVAQPARFKRPPYQTPEPEPPNPQVVATQEVIAYAPRKPSTPREEDEEALRSSMPTEPPLSASNPLKVEPEPEPDIDEPIIEEVPLSEEERAEAVEQQSAPEAAQTDVPEAITEGPEPSGEEETDLPAQQPVLADASEVASAEIIAEEVIPAAPPTEPAPSSEDQAHREPTFAFFFKEFSSSNTPEASDVDVEAESGFDADEDGEDTSREHPQLARDASNPLLAPAGVFAHEGDENLAAYVGPGPLSEDLVFDDGEGSGAGEDDAQLQEDIERARFRAEKRPESATAVYHLGRLLARKGDEQAKREALEILSRVVDLEPDHPGAHYATAELLAEEGQFEGADEHLRRARRLGYRIGEELERRVAEGVKRSSIPAEPSRPPAK